MTIDRDAALAAPPATSTIAWTVRDVLLYHLSLGAGAGSAGPELHYTYEAGLRVLPTFAMVAGSGPSAGDGTGAPAGGGAEAGPPRMRLPGIDVGLSRVLHAGQELRVHRPLPASGTAELSARVVDVADRGKAAVIVRETTAAGPDGSPLWTARSQIWARGEGGFGGAPGPRAQTGPPDRAPDAVLEAPTSPDQALLYRLNGDLNPLHADPGFARAAGFDRPILHGLCSYGLVAKSVVDRLLDGDPDRLRALTARFSGTLAPGETIRTDVWRDGDRLLLHASCPERDGAPVLTRATAEVAQ
ncbi:MaoC/PaaZ C-terminal domain-containing protein [Nocardiopsis coralliicola]